MAATPSGFWTFTAEELAPPLTRDANGLWRSQAQERLVLGYLRDVASTDRDALARLIEVGKLHSHSQAVRAAAHRLYCRWQAWQARRSGAAAWPEAARRHVERPSDSVSVMANREETSPVRIP
jgi:hypothetical protein